MPKSKVTIVIGVFIALLPFLGFPPKWDTFFEIVAGLSIVFFSVWSSIDRRLIMKAKAEKRMQRKRALVDVTLARENPDMYGRREVDKHPEEVVVEGRRAADIVPEARVGRRASDRKVVVKDADVDIFG